jgi:hypothetical protein
MCFTLLAAKLLIPERHTQPASFLSSHLRLNAPRGNGLRSRARTWLWLLVCGRINVVCTLLDAFRLKLTKFVEAEVVDVTQLLDATPPSVATALLIAARIIVDATLPDTKGHVSAGQLVDPAHLVGAAPPSSPCEWQPLWHAEGVDHPTKDSSRGRRWTMCTCASTIGAVLVDVGALNWLR